MRDYLTLSWARFSKDVQSHTMSVIFALSRDSREIYQFRHLHVM